MLLSQSISKNSVILGAFALVTMGLVVITQQLTAPAIAQAKQQALQEALHEVLPSERITNDISQDRIRIEPNPLLNNTQPFDLYRARHQDTPIASVLQSVAPDGYGGSITLLIGVLTNGEISGVRVIPPHFETPGLGDAIDIEKSDWIRSFNGRSLANTPTHAWGVRKDGGEFDAFTGATITPRAVIGAVHRALQFHAQQHDRIHGDRLHGDRLHGDRLHTTPPASTVDEVSPNE